MSERERPTRGAYAVLAFPVAMLVIFFLIPFGIMVATSFYHRVEGAFWTPAFELDNWQRLFHEVFLERAVFSIAIWGATRSAELSHEERPLAAGAAGALAAVGFTVTLAAIVVGIIVIATLRDSLDVLAWLTGALWIVVGIIEFVAVFRAEDSDVKGIGLAMASITVVFGIVLVAWPDKTNNILAIIVGIYLALAGIMQIASALRKPAAEPATAA